MFIFIEIFCHVWVWRHNAKISCTKEVVFCFLLHGCFLFSSLLILSPTRVWFVFFLYLWSLTSHDLRFFSFSFFIHFFVYFRSSNLISFSLMNFLFLNRSPFYSHFFFRFLVISSWRNFSLSTDFFLFSLIRFLFRFISRILRLFLFSFFFALKSCCFSCLCTLAFRCNRVIYIFFFFDFLIFCFDFLIFFLNSICFVIMKIFFNNEIFLF